MRKKVESTILKLSLKDCSPIFTRLFKFWTRQVDSISQRVLSLTADPDFDPNKPFNRAVLAEMISVGGGMFRDNPEGFLPRTGHRPALRRHPG